MLASSAKVRSLVDLRDVGEGGELTPGEDDEFKKALTFDIPRLESRRDRSRDEVLEGSWQGVGGSASGDDGEKV
jgi:hypothetical protein